MADYFAHETAIVEDGASIGADSKIWHWVHVMPGAKLGERCVVGQGCYIGRDVQLGDNVHVQNNVSVYENVTIEDDVFCGPSMVFTNVINPRSHVPRKDEFLDTLVKKGASIGANATVICGNNIGRYAFIGAGAVVTKDVPDFALMVGTPARRMGWMCQCGIRLHLDGEAGTCEACGDSYILEGEELRHA
jgi:UDP-2-acetamido-3-amino-2,3-dideoxy-glucuronate N-acetyltransferase